MRPPTTVIKMVAIARQAQAVQDALAEQRNFTRTGTVEETVSLEELVRYCTDIVPNTLRQRLSMQFDRSVSAVGPLRLARTTLQQVLQNLFVNAAEATRDAGRARGALRMSAEIVPGTPREQLHLTLEDEGVGIATEHLEHIFERGFSTKSRDTNSGIGLHWCANALQALGGTIHAISAGPGRGACLHVLIPVDQLEKIIMAEVA